MTFRSDWRQPPIKAAAMHAARLVKCVKICNHSKNNCTIQQDQCVCCKRGRGTLFNPPTFSNMILLSLCFRRKTNTTIEVWSLSKRWTSCHYNDIAGRMLKLCSLFGYTRRCEASECNNSRPKFENRMFQPQADNPRYFSSSRQINQDETSKRKLKLVHPRGKRLRCMRPMNYWLLFEMFNLHIYILQRCTEEENEWKALEAKT